MGYKVLLFDADGTLFNFRIAEKRAFKNTIIHFKLKGDIQYFHKIYEKYNVAIWKEFEEGKISSSDLRVKRFRQFLDHISINLNPAQMSVFYLKELAKGTDLIVGAKELIASIAENDNRFELAIITNGIADVQYPRIINSALAKYFEGKIYVSEELGYPKPDKRFFERVLQDYSTFDLSEILIIGDSLYSDVKGGIDCNIATCWMNPEGKIREIGLDPDHEISDLSEILNVLGIK